MINTHIGLLSPPVPSHLNTMITLGLELQKRNIKVTYFQVPELEAQIRAVGFDFLPIGKADWKKGSLNKYTEQLGKKSGLAGLFYAIATNRDMNRIICRDVPTLAKKAGIELLLVDQIQPAGGSVAEYLQIPFVTVCNALAMNREPGIPPFCTPWDYYDSWWARYRNQVGFYLLDRAVEPIRQVINNYRRHWQLAPLNSLFEDSASPFAQISKHPATFDFPRVTLPKNFHYTGPWFAESSSSVPFPFEQLSDKPLIYASLGTLQGCKKEIFQIIAKACAQLDVQLVITLGGRGKIENFRDLPGKPIVVEYAPQVKLLARAQLTITHAGLNTVIESLTQGVPLVAIPIMFEQPAVGARLRWLGAGEVVFLSKLTVFSLKNAISKVLIDKTYYQVASRIKDSFLQSGGVQRAADIVQQVITTQKPVFVSSAKLQQNIAFKVVETN
jgi:zeaxanthin glucosyltransferase